MNNSIQAQLNKLFKLFELKFHLINFKVNSSILNIEFEQFRRSLIHLNCHRRYCIITNYYHILHYNRLEKNINQWEHSVHTLPDLSKRVTRNHVHSEVSVGRRWVTPSSKVPSANSSLLSLKPRTPFPNQTPHQPFTYQLVPDQNQNSMTFNRVALTQPFGT